MNKELIPIIASYWGCECSYTASVPYPFSSDITDDKDFFDNLNGELLHMISEGDYTNLKLHLRPLWSITEEELRELAKAIPGGFIIDRVPTKGELMEWNSYVLSGDIDLSIYVINYLRSKGFCLDQSLIDADLVEWVEDLPVRGK